MADRMADRMAGSTSKAKPSSLARWRPAHTPADTTAKMRTPAIWCPRSPRVRLAARKALAAVDMPVGVRKMIPTSLPTPSARRDSTRRRMARGAARRWWRSMERVMSKPCEHCGKPLEKKRLRRGEWESPSAFGRRKFCDRKCMAEAFDARPTTGTSWMTTHHHARKLVPAGPCKRCGALRASDVHHKDGDHQNNSPNNLERLCRRCHMLEHREIVSCTVCGKPQKGLGFCDRHYQRFKKHGDPMMVKINQNTPLGRSDD